MDDKEIYHKVKDKVTEKWNRVALLSGCVRFCD
jgi:hypothetical protein